MLLWVHEGKGRTVMTVESRSTAPSLSPPHRVPAIPIANHSIMYAQSVFIFTGADHYMR